MDIGTRPSMRKFEIPNLILEHYLQSGVVASEATQYVVQDPNVTDNQKLEFECIALEREELNL